MEASPTEAEAPAEAPVERAAVEVADPAPPSALDLAGWGSILATYRTEDGGFRYAALHAATEDRAKLNAFTEAIATASVEGLSRDEALAFYINAYNALTIASVLELWPVENVLSEEGFFDERTHQVAGQTVTLNALENETIRGERFAEPRIHFAVNCASTSCPPLQPLPFTAENLEAQLAAGAREHVRRTTEIAGRRATVSQLFEWFEGDFERVGGVRAFVAAQLDEAGASTVSNERTRLRYRPYDWSINARE